MNNTIPYDRLLRELAALTHDRRVQRMIELGRQSRTAPAAVALRARLEQGGPYERLLALHMCYGSGDGSHALRAITDPSRGIRSVAIQLVAIVCDDAQARAALALLHPRHQRKLLTLLAKRRRTDPIDAWLLAADAATLPQFLPYGSPSVVAQLLHSAFASAGADDWRRLAARHLEIAAATLAEQAAAATTFDQRLLWLANAVLPELALRAPDQALALVRTLRAHISLYQLELQALALRRPEALVDLIVETGDHVKIDFSALADRLDEARLRALIERGLLNRPEVWLPQLDVERRRAAYALAGLGWRDTDGALPLAVVQALPHELRLAEARRHLALPALLTRPPWRLPYAACLPWDEAQAALEPFIRNPDPELRTLALPALIGAARYQPARLADALALVTARRNE
ncbi:MAG: hypothetical protein H7Z42_01430, partial [Roseiflexaceae bacterium]|nr:hypothetical protein [Roseiflexaceae bacterium]